MKRLIVFLVALGGCESTPAAAIDMAVDPGCGVVAYCFAEQGAYCGADGKSGFCQCSDMYVSGVAAEYRACLITESTTGRCRTVCARGDGGAGGGCETCLTAEAGACTREHLACR